MENPIGEIIGWKFDHFPGMTTRAGVITEWPEALGPPPTTEQLEGWDSELEIFKIEQASTPSFDDDVILALTGTPVEQAGAKARLKDRRP